MIFLSAGNRNPLHHLLELAEIDSAVPVPIHGANHLAHRVHLLPLLQSQLPKNHLQLHCRDKTISILIENLKSLLHVRLGLGFRLRSRLGPEERVAQGPVKRHEVLELEAGLPGPDVGAHGGVKLGGVGFQAELMEGSAQLEEGDDAVAVAVEDVEDAAEAEGVEAGVAEAEGGRGSG